MIRLLFLLHRYLGIAVGALMVMWCISGVAMMYVSYPDLDENVRLHHLTPIVWSGCCKISDHVLADEDPVSDFQIEMLAGRPVLRLRTSEKYRLVDLMTGLAIDRVSSEQAASVASAYTDETLPAAFQHLSLIDYDQWTVAGNFDADRPLYYFMLNDPLRTELYVSSSAGKAVQMTTQHERFWNWFGAVPHWLYFAELRRRTSLWGQVVIATSLLGCFLAGTGIYIGVRQLLRQLIGPWSPYTGFNFWHHIAGLVFGLLTLTWVLSGLVSMNPWGWLEGESAQTERAKLRGQDISGSRVKVALKALAAAAPADMVSLKMAALNGQLYFIASTTQGDRHRLGASAASTPLNDQDLSHVAAALSGTGPPIVPWLMKQEDRYYFSHHREMRPLPVYRMTLRDGSDTRYYIDPVSGMLVAKIDRAAQSYRWLHQGFHRMDFTAALRRRPQWDTLMLLLMLGVAVVCVTGAYLGYCRLVRSAVTTRSGTATTRQRGVE